MAAVVTACSAQYEPPYQYRCTAGHVLAASCPVAACPVYRHGEPCPGTLTRFGAGSRLALARQP